MIRLRMDGEMATLVDADGKALAVGGVYAETLDAESTVGRIEAPLRFVGEPAKRAHGGGS